MQEPFLAASSSSSSRAVGGRRRSRNEGSSSGCCCGCCRAICSGCLVACGRGRFLCCRSLTVLLGATIALWIGITRNLYCNPDALEGVEPPYGGQIIPLNVSLVERKYFFQFTKLVDVYDRDKDMAFVGYFYDINLLFLMRFGFSDASRRIWFEARYASLLSRFKPIIEYTLQRCDTGRGGRTSELFQLKEDWWRESWFCVYHCNRKFALSRHETSDHVMEGLLPEAGFAEDPVARVVFDSHLTPTFRGKVTGAVENAGVGFRHRWEMNVTNTTNGKTLATAHQHFITGHSDSNFDVLSRWSLIQDPSSTLPNWVVAFLSVLDDIEEEYGR